MAHVIRWLKDGTAVLAVRAGQTLFVSGAVSQTLTPFVTRRVMHSSTSEIIVASDILLRVADYDEESWQAHRLFYARNDRYHAEAGSPMLAFQSKPTTFPRLRRALRIAEEEQSELKVSRITVEEGFQHALAYPDELLVGDYAKDSSGNCGWSIKRSQVEPLLAMVPEFHIRYTEREAA
ncbi:MAG: hypothetical protein WA001_04290 [Patescibacteria group bacterium]